MKAPKVPVRIEGTDEYLLMVDDGEEWNAITEAFHHHFPDRAGKPFALENYSQAEIDAVMIEFEPKKKPASAATTSANSD